MIFSVHLHFCLTRVLLVAVNRLFHTNGENLRRKLKGQWYIRGEKQSTEVTLEQEPEVLVLVVPNKVTCLLSVGLHSLRAADQLPCWYSMFASLCIIASTYS